MSLTSSKEPGTSPAQQQPLDPTKDLTAEPTTAAATFLKFMQLPKELRDAIWRYAMPEDVPELLFYNGPASMEEDNNEESVMVNTGYPALMHVCSESRVVAKRETCFDYSRNAEAEIPMRKFCPDLDMQYLTVWDAEDAEPAPGCRHVTGLGIMQMRYQWMCSFETYTHLMPADAVAPAVEEGAAKAATIAVTPWAATGGLLDDYAPGSSACAGPRYRARVRFVDAKALVDPSKAEGMRKMEQYMHNVYKARCDIDPSLDPDCPRPHFRMGVFEMWLKDKRGSLGWHPTDY
ncbi:hypothetical protein PG996_015419 [Apiospora saccharicola]|uniref:2EXR domain-containing protein n=1 Tax=Apiospora saccharicola TaxID=335842 RepID=A0ABR1TL19_9PEZI